MVIDVHEVTGVVRGQFTKDTIATITVGDQFAILMRHINGIPTRPETQACRIVWMGAEVHVWRTQFGNSINGIMPDFPHCLHFIDVKAPVVNVTAEASAAEVHRNTNPAQFVVKRHSTLGVDLRENVKRSGQAGIDGNGAFENGTDLEVVSHGNTFHVVGR